MRAMEWCGDGVLTLRALREMLRVRCAYLGIFFLRKVLLKR
jgi:hypothetical protein